MIENLLNNIQRSTIGTMVKLQVQNGGYYHVSGV
jgi:hypothetical protein